MIKEINDYLENYQYILTLGSIIFPFAMAICMAIVAYQQYKITQHIEFCKLNEEVDKIVESKIKDIEKNISDIFNSKDKSINKPQKIVELVSSLPEEIKKYKHIIEHYDVELIEEAYVKVEKWAKETEKYTWNLKEIWYSFNVVTGFIGYLVHAKYCYIANPNKTPTIYELFGKFINRIYTFFIPYFIQKIIKRIYCSIFFKLKALIYILNLLWDIIVSLYKDLTKKNKVKEVDNDK